MTAPTPMRGWTLFSTERWPTRWCCRCASLRGHRKPSIWSMRRAVPLTGLTAMQLLRRLDLHLDETVLVHNASGGVGQFAVQLARLAGAR